MIVTEEEAKTKRCQEGFGTQHSFEVLLMEGVSVSGTPMCCIGSACMAWRRQVYGVMVTPEGDEPKYTGKGFCGKAGG